MSTLAKEYNVRALTAGYSRSVESEEEKKKKKKFDRNWICNTIYIVNKTCFARRQELSTWSFWFLVHVPGGRGEGGGFSWLKILHIYRLDDFIKKSVCLQNR